MRAVGDILLGQQRDGHRAFALAVNLREPRPEPVERAQRVLDVHRRAAPHDGADVLRVAVGRAFDQPLDHGGGREHRAARPRSEQAEDLLRLEPGGFRYHVDGEPGDVRHHVEA